MIPRKKKNTNTLNSSVMIQSITRIISNAESIALPNNRIIVVPAPGAGKMNAYLFSVVDWDTQAGAYGNILPEAVFGFTHTDGTDAACSAFMDLADFNNEPTREGYVLPQYSRSYPAGSRFQGESFLYPTPNSERENRPISAYIFNEEQNLTGGHADNKLKVTVYYVVVGV